MLSLVGIGAPEAKPDPTKPMLAVSKQDQKLGVAQGETCKVKYVIPQSFAEKIEKKLLWIGCYKHGEGLAVGNVFRPSDLKGFFEMSTSDLVVGAWYVFSLKEGEVWPLITTYCTTNKLPIVPPLLPRRVDEEESKTPVLRHVRSRSQPPPVAPIEQMEDPFADQDSAAQEFVARRPPPPPSPGDLLSRSPSRRSAPLAPAPVPPGRLSASARHSQSAAASPQSRTAASGGRALPPARPAPTPTRARGNSAPTKPIAPVPRPISSAVASKAIAKDVEVRASWGSPAPERREPVAIAAAATVSAPKTVKKKKKKKKKRESNKETGSTYKVAAVEKAKTDRLSCCEICSR